MSLRDEERPRLINGWNTAALTGDTQAGMEEELACSPDCERSEGLVRTSSPTAIASLGTAESLESPAASPSSDRRIPSARARGRLAGDRHVAVVVN